MSSCTNCHGSDVQHTSNECPKTNVNIDFNPISDTSDIPTLPEDSIHEPTSPNPSPSRGLMKATNRKPVEESKTGAAPISIADTSELDKLAHKWHQRGWELHPNCIKEFQTLLDTEIAKARESELERFSASYLTNEGDKYLTKRYQQLKGEEK